MSIIVAIKNGDGYLVAGDFYYYYNGIYRRDVNLTNARVWQDKNEPSIILAQAGYARMRDLVKQQSFFEEEIKEFDKEYIINNIMIPMAKFITETERHDVKKSLTLRSMTFVIKGDKGFAIDYEGSVFEMEDLYIESNSIEENFIHGALLANEHLEPRERLIKVFRAANEHLRDVGLPIIIANSKTLEFEIIEE